MSQESGDSAFEKVFNYRGLDPGIQTIGDGNEQLQGSFPLQLLSWAVMGLCLFSLLSHPKLQFPDLYEGCGWADLLARQPGQMVNFIPGEGTGGKKGSWIPSLRSGGLQCCSQGKGLRHSGSGKNRTVAEILQLLSWNFPYRKARGVARWYDKMAFRRLWLYLLKG